MPEDPQPIDKDGTLEKKRRFDQRDFDFIAEFVCDEYARRKRDRKDQEKQWAEIDRQIAMDPVIDHKLLQNGKMDPDKTWMAEMELPLQAQALEVLTADARRMMFPDNGSFFSAHAETTDEYLEQDFGGIVVGDRNEVPSLIDQDNADKLVEGFLMHLFNQYDHAERVTRINAESFKYGMGIGRGRMLTKNVYIHESRGVRKERQHVPVIVPCSVKNTYLDDPMPSNHSATVLGEAHISEDHIKLNQLTMAANKGSQDPMDEDGGWIPRNVSKIVPDDNDYVKLLEMEGDIVVPRKTTRDMVIPGAIVTVALGGTKDSSDDPSIGVVRFRFRKNPWSSYILFPYHYESASGAYPTSPLMKGRPVQIMAVQALNRLLDSAALKNSPPIGYDQSSAVFATEGGPVVHPGAQWGTIDPIQVYDQVGGDPGALAQMMSLGVNLYAELTGVLPARLGAQTVSHTTAFSKQAELERGAVRTVNYVRRVGKGAMTRWLDMAYQMGRDKIQGNVSFFIKAYGGFVQVTKEQLPERSAFEWFGAGGPAEEAEKRQNKINSLGLAMQMEQLARSAGEPPRLDIAAAQREVLREGGWTDLDTIITGTTESPAADQAAPGVPGTAGEAGTPAALNSIQALLTQ